MSSRKGAATFGRWKRWQARLRVLVGVLLAVYCLFVANLISFRHPIRYDLTAEGRYTLSADTRTRLENVGETIRVILPVFVQRDNPEHAVHSLVLARARRLLEEYVAVQPRIRIEAEVDIFAEPHRWTEIRERFDLIDTQVNRLIFVTGSADEFRQTVTPQDLATFGRVSDPRMQAPEILDFHAEKAITDAITRLILRERIPVYVTQSHGELPLEPSTAESGGGGLTRLSHELETSGFEVHALYLAAAQKIPDDAAVVMIPRPLRRFAAEEIARLEKYLQSGGKLLVALGPPHTGLEDLLGRWAVGVESGMVAEVRTVGPTSQRSTEPIARRFHVGHPVTSPFSGAQRFELGLYLPRPLAPSSRESGLVATSLVDLVSGPAAGDALYYRLEPSGDPGDLPRPEDFSVAVAVEQNRPERPPPDFQPLDSRLVVVGGASFLADGGIAQKSHRDFTMSALAWLVGQESLVSISGQEWTKRSIKMDASISRYLFWMPVVVFPGVCLCFGVFVYFVRRS